MASLDGIHPHQRLNVEQTPQLSKPKRRWFLQLAIVVGLMGLLGVSVQPIFAALPFPNAQDDLKALRLLRPGVYLVLFQNPRELRPTGGFLGSFAEVEVGWGFQIKHIKVETNIYQRDNAYASLKSQDPPQPIAAFLGGSPWALRDSNWALDFPEAAQTIAWFYAQEGGRPVDGVIATDSRLLERLLRITGPIQLGTGSSISAETVVEQLQTEVEKTYWQDPAHVRENQPKAILATLLPKLLSELKHQSPSQLLGVLEAAFREKELLVYSRDPTLATLLGQMDWDGHVLATPGDYLYVNEANLTPVDGRVRAVGAKSSWSINRSLRLQRSYGADGTTEHQLTLVRRHEGKNEWPDGPNQSFLRIAVPNGATLLAAKRDGVPITSEIRLSTEAGKTVFGVWSRLQPGDQETLEFTYQTVGQSKLLTIERQPGAPGYPVDLIDPGAHYTGDLNQDLFLNP